MKLGKAWMAGILAAGLLLSMSACNRAERPEEPETAITDTTEDAAQTTAFAGLPAGTALSSSAEETTGTAAETAPSAETAATTKTAAKTTQTTGAPAPSVTVPAATKPPEPSVILPTAAPTAAPTRPPEQPEEPEYTLLDSYAKNVYGLYTLDSYDGKSVITLEMEGMTLSAQRTFRVAGRSGGLRKNIRALVTGKNTYMVPEVQQGEAPTPGSAAIF